MKKSLPRNKKLSLSKETIRLLSVQELKAAAGAGVTQLCPASPQIETNCCYSCQNTQCC